MIIFWNNWFLIYYSRYGRSVIYTYTHISDKYPLKLLFVSASFTELQWVEEKLSILSSMLGCHGCTLFLQYLKPSKEHIFFPAQAKNAGEIEMKKHTSRIEGWSVKSLKPIQNRLCWTIMLRQVLQLHDVERSFLGTISNQHFPHHYLGKHSLSSLFSWKHPYALPKKLEKLVSSTG